MKFFDSKQNRLISSEELIPKYGTENSIPLLGIYPLSIQPDYVPVAFTDLGNGSWYPVESYEALKDRAMSALVATGMTETQAVDALS